MEKGEEGGEKGEGRLVEAPKARTGQLEIDVPVQAEASIRRVWGCERTNSLNVVS